MWLYIFEKIDELCYGLLQRLFGQYLRMTSAGFEVVSDTNSRFIRLLLITLKNIAIEALKYIDVTQRCGLGKRLCVFLSH